MSESIVSSTETVLEAPSSSIPVEDLSENSVETSVISTASVGIHVESVSTTSPVIDLDETSTSDIAVFTPDPTTSIQPAPVADAVNETPVEHDEL